jgi:hypothetical protein
VGGRRGLQRAAQAVAAEEARLECRKLSKPALASLSRASQPIAGVWVYFMRFMGRRMKIARYGELIDRQFARKERVEALLEQIVANTRGRPRV